MFKHSYEFKLKPDYLSLKSCVQTYFKKIPLNRRLTTLAFKYFERLSCYLALATQPLILDITQRKAQPFIKTGLSGGGWFSEDYSSLGFDCKVQNLVITPLNFFHLGSFVFVNRNLASYKLKTPWALFKHSLLSFRYIHINLSKYYTFMRREINYNNGNCKHYGTFSPLTHQSGLCLFNEEERTASSLGVLTKAGSDKKFVSVSSNLATLHLNSLIS